MDDSPAVPGVGLGELRAALSSTDPARRVSALSRARMEAGVDDVMISALGDANEEVRRAAVRALARIGTAPATRALATAASRDLSPAVRAEAVAALGRLLAAPADGSAGSSDLQPQ
jgi:HEAT repeat protein